jgi:hypothetical protein
VAIPSQFMMLLNVSCDLTESGGERKRDFFASHVRQQLHLEVIEAGQTNQSLSHGEDFFDCVLTLNLKSTRPAFFRSKMKCKSLVL